MRGALKRHVLYEMSHTVHFGTFFVACAAVNHETTVHHRTVGCAMYDAQAIVEGNALVLRIICHSIFQFRSKTAQIYKKLIIK